MPRIQLLCSICHRPKLGQKLDLHERPCQVPGGQRCYELGFERVAAQLKAAKRILRRVEGELFEVAQSLTESEASHG